RLPRPGQAEIMVGSMLATKVGVLASEVGLNQQLFIEKRPWTIVGHFSSPGTVMDPEVWMPLGDLKEATKRTTDSCVVLSLDPRTAEFADVATFTKTRVDLELAATPEPVYYAKLSSFFYPIRVLAWSTAVLVALGGFLGGLNTMYAAFAS